MTAGSIQQMAERVAQLIEDRLRVRGPDLAEKLRRGGRLLPRRVRRAAEELAVAAAHVRNPRLITRVDPARAAQAYDICLRHLQTLGASERRRDYLLAVVTSSAFGVVVAAALVIGVMIWRDLL